MAPKLDDFMQWPEIEALEYGECSRPQDVEGFAAVIGSLRDTERICIRHARIPRRCVRRGHRGGLVAAGGEQSRSRQSGNSCDNGEQRT